MKSLFAICVVICACISTIEEGYAAITCTANPQGTRTTCVELGTGRGWITLQAPNGNTITVPLAPSSDRKAPPHNYSECTIATGCNPYKQ